MRCGDPLHCAVYKEGNKGPMRTCCTAMQEGGHMFGGGRTLSSFKVGDKVTVRGPSDRPFYHNGSHGTVVTIGTKRVHVKMDVAAFADHDGEMANFLPGDLEPGHVGTPRNSDRMNDAFTAFKLGTGIDVVAVALEAGIITAEQGEQIKAVWTSHVQN